MANYSALSIHGARKDQGMPAINMSDEDVKAVAAFIRSVLAKGARARRSASWSGRGVEHPRWRRQGRRDFFQ
jgi:mono/diheme cytochrome c family protein